MNSVVELFTEDEQFFAPSSTDMIDGLMGQYRFMREKIERVAEFVADDMTEAVDYFMTWLGGLIRFWHRYTRWQFHLNTEPSQKPSTKSSI